jgi:transcriptional repressor NrdR
VNCPYCEHGETKVVDSRVAGKGAIRRRRECLLCQQRFTTFERIEETPLFVVKRDGTRQPFERSKLLAGLVRACTKRPVSIEQIERTAATIEAGLRNGIREEVSSQDIGDEALAVLHDLDAVAYVRFASVYRDFQDVEEFERELARMEESGRTRVR